MTVFNSVDCYVSLLLLCCLCCLLCDFWLLVYYAGAFCVLFDCVWIVCDCDCFVVWFGLVCIVGLLCACGLVLRWVWGLGCVAGLVWC